MIDADVETAPIETPVTDEACERIRAARRSGATHSRLAEEFGLSKTHVRDHCTGRCDHHDGPDPLREEIRKHILEQVEADGGEWYARSRDIARGMDWNSLQIRPVIMQIRDGDDPDLTAEKWNGKESPWIITRRETDGGDAQ